MAPAIFGFTDAALQGDAAENQNMSRLATMFHQNSKELVAFFHQSNVNLLQHLQVGHHNDALLWGIDGRPNAVTC